ncbi:amino acid permease [Heliobacterium gestii]|uniref:Amino acid permease n=1 Tax=Heliomicrobium gestii TaxID=2699 RepID=A0A845LH58_HELGE|nr:APC family permease [Heliomicrobium gestii]MBM7866767.1 amino acid transporter [Heliomicrobium gestii]MZP42196.1 amino acid permease [Heliomicrobium gestii]
MLRRLLIGSKLHNRQLTHETITKPKALAIFASDALSSVAYATEEILLVLAVIGQIAFHYLPPIAFCIVLLLFTVILSYTHVIRTYPEGGGAYSVAKEFLGPTYGCIIGASLVIDYVLTIAVSISSGTAAITSAFPSLFPHTVAIAVFFIVLLTIINLRGISESANLLAYPPYFFIFSMLALIATGFYRYFSGDLAPQATPYQGHASDLGNLVFVWILLKAFAGGCTALTGVEAVADGVPSFKEPKESNAIKVLLSLGGLSVILFGGISVLAGWIHVLPQHGETLVSQIAETVFGGRTFMYYFLQAATAVILILAANTAFAGAPIMAAKLASEGYIPRVFALRGDRLVFHNGILLLCAGAITLVVIFHGSVHSLIPLYAVGVFLAFTIAQTGMVVRWNRLKPKGYKMNALVNGIGATVTGVVTIVIASTKFMAGAWLVLLAIPMLVLLFKKIKRHYTDMAQELSSQNQSPYYVVKNHILIPISSLSKPALNALEFAKSMSNEDTDITIVHVSSSPETAEKLQKKLQEKQINFELVVIESPYRELIDPLVNYIDNLEKNLNPGEVVTVIIPEFVAHTWWHYLLHNQTGFLLRTVLLLKKNTIVASVPYHLRNR